MSETPRLGALLPDLTFPDLSGKRIALSEFRGKKLLLFVWGSW